MQNATSVRKFIKVWVKRRKNRKNRVDRGKVTFSYTLQWVDRGREHYQSLGPYATSEFAKEMARRKQEELNSLEQASPLDAIGWADFERKYLDTVYPGHGSPPKERQEAMKAWGKSLPSMKAERLALANFGRIVKPGLVHEITTRDQEAFVSARIKEVGSAASVDADLRGLRTIFHVMEEWKHRPEGSNPFAGRGKSTVGARRKRAKERERDQLQQEGGEARKEKHYTYDEVRKILALVTKEADEAAEKDRYAKRRLRALVYFMAYTGCRFSEAVHLEWKDVDWENGVAFLYFKIENDLKTAGSEAPFGLPDRLVEVLRDWQKDATCGWVFPNNKGKPWKTGSVSYRPFDQMQALGERAGIQGANFKRFRSSLATHGKQRFGMSAEQIRAQLRHTTLETQKHYEKDDLANLRDAMKGVDFEG